MNGQIITYEPFVKLLGSYFDSHLTWNYRIRQLKINTQKSINILIVVLGYTWGADQTSLLKLYNALCKSKLNYACQIYSSASKSTLRSLDVVHNQALRICTGAYRTSPIESLMVISGERPLDYYRKQLSINFILKSRGFPYSSSHQILSNYGLQRQYQRRPRSSTPLHIRMDDILVESELKDIKIHNAQHHRNIPWTMPDIKICNFNPEKSKLSASHACSFFREHLTIHAGLNFIFTNGSKTNDAAGCAAIIGQS